MGFLDTIRGAMGQSADSNHEGLLDEAMKLLGNSSGTGGLSGLLDKFKGAGLGHLADGWVSTGPNPPATSENIKTALGSEQIKQIAAKLGIPPEQAASSLATILPHLVDQATPSGSVPDQSAMGGVLQSLKGKLFGTA